MSTNPINTSPIQQFIQQTQTAESGKAKEVRLTLDQAKTLSYTLGLVMSRLHGDLEKFVVAHTEKMKSDQVIEISMDSGDWK